LAQDVLRQKPAGGAVFAFRGREGDRLKLLYWDGQGFCLYYKHLEKSAYCWPLIGHVRVQLNYAQIMAWQDGLDWKRVRPVAVKAPVFAGQSGCDKVNQPAFWCGYPAACRGGTFYL